jgi:hypothetical protein
LVLGRTAVKGQQTSEKADPDKPTNLYEPVGGDPGAHGRFDDRVHDFSPQLWTSLHREWIVGGVLVGILAMVGGLLSTNRRKSE